MALPVSVVTDSFWASQRTTQGWFQRSCIHSVYFLISSSALRAAGHWPPCQMGNSSWIMMPSSSAMRYQASGGKPMQ